jgi:hypothetical protein
MAAVFDNPAVVENEDAVHQSTIGEAMRYKEESNALQKAGNPAKDMKLRLRIQGGGRFVEN